MGASRLTPGKDQKIPMRSLHAPLTLLVLAAAWALAPACQKNANDTPARGTAPEAPPGQVAEAPPPQPTAVPTPSVPAAPPDVDLDLAPGYRFKVTTLPPGTLARTGGRELSVTEVQGQMKLLRAGGSSGHQDPAATRTAALHFSLDQLLASKKLAQGRYAKDERLVRLGRIYRLLYLGRRYEREKILPKVEVSAAEIAARMPQSREQLRLVLLMLNPDDEAAIRSAYESGTPFEQLVAKYSRTGADAGMGDLGWQRRGHTIFGADSEELLWQVPMGKISPVLNTPVGPILAQVTERRRYSDEEWAANEVAARSAAAALRARVYTQAIYNRHTVTPLAAEFGRIAAAMAAEDRHTDAIVGRVDGVEVSFHDLDRMMGVSYQDITLNATAGQIRMAYQGFFRQVAAVLALGLEAERLGMQLDDRDTESLAAFMAQASIRVALQDVLKGVSVGPEEIEKHYETHRARFAGVSAARLQVVVVKEMETALEVVEKFREGGNFTELVARYSIDTATQARGGDTGLQPVERYPAEVALALIEADEGELLPIYPSEGTFTVGLVRQKVRERPSSFAEARSSISRRLLSGKRTEAIRSYLVTLRGDQEVEFDRAQFEAIPLPKAAAPPSHGARHGMPSGLSAPAGGRGMPAGHPALGGGQGR